MSDIKCPHCGFENDTTDWIEYFTHDGDDFVIECRSCKNDFDVVANLSVSYKVLNSEAQDD